LPVPGIAESAAAPLIGAGSGKELLKARYRLKGFDNSDLGANKLERNYILLLGTPAVCAFAYLVMPFSKRIPPREKHSQQIGERPVRGEIPRIGVGIAFVLRSHFFFENVSNRRLVRLVWGHCHRRCRQHGKDQRNFQVVPPFS
jgi:hypothetical protein